MAWVHVATKRSHWQFTHPTLPGRVTVPHPKGEPPVGALRSIEKQCGVTLRWDVASYIALVRKDVDSDYGIEFPDFPGCISVGKTMEEARRMSMEALAVHIAGMVRDGAAIPEPSGMEAVAASAEARGAMLMVVDGPAKSAAKSVRVNVLLPEDLVEKIDRASGNRSRFLADAARAKLGEAA